MKQNCDTSNPLLRDGVSRAQRMLKALDLNYVKIDERTVADFLCWAQRYGETLQYYDEENRPAGNWQAFFQRDISMAIAQIQKQDLADQRHCLTVISDIFQWADTVNAELRDAIKLSFLLISASAVEIDGWYRNAAAGMKLHAELQRIISAQLRGLLTQAIGFYNCALEDGIILPLDVEPNIPGCIELPAAILAPPFTAAFDPIWIDPSATDAIGNPFKVWQNYKETIAKDCTIFSGDADDLILYRIAGKRLVTMVDVFLNTRAQLQQQAPGFMLETLENWPNHEPHLALFLTFVQLFGKAQDHLNGINERHLDFYYRDVLGFTEKPAVPDKVHLLFQLAKHTDTHLLKSATMLDAGKDALGKSVSYRTGRETVLNKATVSQLKTVFIDCNDQGRIYAAPVANSADGQGAEFETDEPKWQTFGSSKLAGNAAEIGFAIASPILFLTEGTRTITITLKTNGLGGITGLNNPDLYKILFSGEGDWIQVDLSSVTVSGNDIVFKTILNPEIPAVMPYDNELFGENYDTTYPVVKFLILNNPASGNNYIYSALKDVKLTGIVLHTDVKGMQNLLLQNDFGPLDPAKPFLPFGPTPKIGSTFYIGSDEVFRKSLASLSIRLNWLDVPPDLKSYYEEYNESPFHVIVQQFNQSGGIKTSPTSITYPKIKSSTFNNTYYKAKWQILKNRQWVPLNNTVQLFDSANATFEKPISHGAVGGFERIPELANVAQLNANTIRGYIKLELSAPAIAFGHQDFARIYAEKVLANAKTPGSEDLPNPPYTPTIKFLTLDYSSQVTFDLQKIPEGESFEKFFHIHSFGQRERLPKEAGVFFLPQFRLSANDATPQGGELYIGLTELEPRQNISILFQVAEGSADPSLAAETVHWTYLSNNEWQSFKSKEILFDSTGGLLKSGIIVFDVPSAANKNNTLLPGEYHWLRASVKGQAPATDSDDEKASNTEAVCDLIDVQAQAVQASFADSGENDPQYLAESLPAGSISKLKVKDAAVKKVEQKYASVGGKTAEEPAQFFTRVSERLRHKGRALTMDNYEKIVLEAFPGIYKAKCINHSTYDFDQEPIRIDKSEFAPGYVTVIVIPNLRNKNAVNPLEPRADLGTREDIRILLSDIMPPFAARRLKVLNPKYEKITVHFSVAYHSGFDWGFYQDQLNKDIKRFLSPWAFADGEDIAFGGKIHRSTILNFVEERPYVGFVKDFKMTHFVDENTINKDVAEAIPTTARSILVSGDAHTINEAGEC